MNFQPLNAERVTATQRVAAELFPWEHEHQVALPAAVSPATHPGFYSSRRLASVRCWSVHVGAGPVCGLASLYGYAAQPQELWLAWFGLSQGARGYGNGAKLLDWVIGVARQEGRTTLRLWTTDEAEYEPAVRLYQSRGFTPEPYPALPGETWQTVVFSLGLRGATPMPWSAVLDRGELCGREAPALAAVAA